MKRCFAIVCVAALIFLGILHASAESSATKVELYCTVNAEGDCLVSMTVNLHIEAADQGLMFPLPYSASSITMNGSSVTTSRVGDATLAAIGRATGGMTGDFPVRFDFTLPNAVKAVSERQLQLTIPMLCGFDYPVENLSFIVTLPSNVPTDPVFTSTYQQVGFASNLDMVVNGNMITGASKNILNDHEAVTMTLAVPPSMFPTVSTYQRNGNPEIIPMSIFAGLALLYWILFLRTLPPIRQRATVPPEGISAGEMNCRLIMSGGDLTAMVFSWAQMGYLMIQLDGNRVLLYKQMDMGNERSLFEVRVFQALFGKHRVIDCTKAHYAKLCRKTAGMVPGENTMCKPGSGNRTIFRSLMCAAQFFCGVCIAMNITSIFVLQILFSIIFGVLSAISAWMIHEFAFAIRSRYKTKAWLALGICLFWVLLGAIAHQPWIPLAAVAVQLVFGYLAAYGGMRTELNRNEAGEILGVRRFMRKIPRPEAARLLKLDPEYFFKMAPYAIAFGITERFSGAFGRRKIADCPYFVTRVPGKRTAEEWMEAMNHAVLIMDDRFRRTELEKWLAVRFR